VTIVDVSISSSSV